MAFHRSELVFIMIKADGLTIQIAIGHTTLWILFPPKSVSLRKGRKQSYQANCSRSISKFDLRSQRKFQWDMTFWGKSYQKTKNSIKIWAGTFTTEVGNLDLFTSGLCLLVYKYFLQKGEGGSVKLQFQKWAGEPSYEIFCCIWFHGYLDVKDL